MPERTAQAHWEGAIKSGHGSIRAGSGAFESEYSFGSRFEDRPGTNPEELLGRHIPGASRWHWRSAYRRQIILRSV
jgi:hypothetical protein